MAITNNSILRLSHFSRLSKWSAYDTVFEGVKTRFPLVPLSMILKRVKEPINIQDDLLYKRITVRLYGQGVLQRDEVLGKGIGTKRQFVAHAGQLIISRIDARNGAFGIVPSELEGAIVTNDFWLFNVHNALPEYLMLVLSSDLFQKYWQTQSSGTTNRQRVSESEFLESRITLPSVSEQMALIESFHKKIGQANKAELESEKLVRELNMQIDIHLGITCSSKSMDHLLSRASFKDLSRWDPTHLANRVIIDSLYSMVSMSKIIKNFMVDNEGHSLRRNTKYEVDNTYQYIGMEQIEKNTGLRKLKFVRGNEISSQTLMVPEGYVIYGKLRPYLNKYWENTTKNSNIICSSEFFVFDTVGIDRQYYLSVLASDIVQRQLPPLFSGARMPRITEDDFFNLQIPLPQESVQKEIATLSAKARAGIIELKKYANNMRQQAKREFEEAVFGEA